MTYQGDFNLGSTVRFAWNTFAIAGESITRATNGTVSVYKNGGTTQSTAGVTDTEDFDGLTGVHYVSIDTSADGSFYSAGADFMVALSGATVDGKVINAVLAEFSIQNRVVAAVTGAVGSVTAAVNANVTQISGDSVAADNLEAAFDGSGITLTGVTVPFVGNTTTVTTVGTNGIDAASLTTAAADKVGERVWNVEARTLSSWGLLVSEIWTHFSRTLTDPVLTRLAAMIETSGEDYRFTTAALEHALADSAGVTTLLSRLSAALSFTAGRVNAQVGGMDANTLTAAALAADATEEIQSGLSRLTTAQVNAEVDAALADYDAPTNAEMVARTLLAADYATAANLLTLSDYVDTEVAAIKAITDRLNTTLELSGSNYRFTVAALENAPAGGGGGGASAADIADAVLDELLAGHTTSGSLAAIISGMKARTDLIVSSQIKYASNFDPFTSTLTLVRGNTPTIQFPVTGDWTGATNIKLGIRRAGEDGTSPIYSITGSVVNSTTLAVTFPANFGIDPELQVGDGVYEWDLTGKLASNEIKTPYAQSPLIVKDRIAQVS